MPHANIVGIGSSVPEKILSNEDLTTIVDTSDEWILRRTGIKERRISTKSSETTTGMAMDASKKALKMAGIDPGELDMIVVGTVTPDCQFPSAACMVQKELEAEKATAFDLSAGCSGFIYALSMVDNAIKTGVCNKALVIGVERLSSILNWDDRSTCVLLGDGAGAVVVDSTKRKTGVLSTHLKSDGKLWNLLYTSYGQSALPDILKGVNQKPFYMHMDGNPLFKRAVGFLSSIAREAMDHNSISKEEIDLLVPHQANMRIIQGVAKSLLLPMEKVYTNVHKYGNTSSASIPIAMDEAFSEGRIKKGDHLLLVAFGAGLTWGSSIIKWSI